MIKWARGLFVKAPEQIELGVNIDLGINFAVNSGSNQGMVYDIRNYETSGGIRSVQENFGSQARRVPSYGATNAQN